jgi:hypothetical protein
MIDAGARAIVHFLNGVADAIDKYEPQIIKAGVRIGEAIVNGMIQGIGNIGGQLLKKVGDLITSLPKKGLKLLGIKSPSTVFREIGENIVLGLSVGIDNTADTATTSIEDMVGSMVDTMNTIPNTLSGLAEMTPVITPVLDLTEVQNGAKQIPGLIDTAPVVGSASYGQASSISSAQAANQSDADSADVTSVGATIKFEQNNYSPESLSPIDIYRQTRNQLSQAKSALAIT